MNQQPGLLPGYATEAWHIMTGRWHSANLALHSAEWSGAALQGYAVRLDDRCGGIGGSAVLRAIRAVSSASRARGLTL